MIGAEEALATLEARGDPRRAAEMAAYHKAPRRYLGLGTPALEALVRDWRQDAATGDLVTLAGALWDSDIHEARVAAAKLLDRARFRPDDSPVWTRIAAWVPTFDAWAVADHAAIAGQKRLTADPARLDEVERWTRSPRLWTRRAALVMTLPWARALSDDLDRRERILGWAAACVDDPEWFMQKAVAWWLRDLSRRHGDRTRAFLADHGERMKPFARREAARHLP